MDRIGYFKLYSTSDLKQSGQDQTEFKSVYSKPDKNIIAGRWFLRGYRRGKKMELTQNLNRWMSADGYPLQGRLVAGLIKDKDQGDGFIQDKARLSVDSWPAASALSAQAAVLSFS
ncbi:hypothetical protein F2Q70_00044321 [Brassica cretica]|uniref:Uncharacterized protein n=1 Tax=Brassica cretica TaxID=69181 RepID=A0A8S9KMB3_BRACR|nr:hypothetical protein F2Q70_00044321 [Brassica cretica]